MDLAWIIVSDTMRAEKFFSETLGLKMVVSSPEHAWSEWQAAEGSFRLGVGGASAEQPSMKAGQNAVLTLNVDNIESAMATLEAKGVQFFGGVVEIPGHVKMATFVDPDGNLFQLVQLLAA